jgi:hypothetical protein
LQELPLRLGRFDEAVAAAKKADRENQTFVMTNLCLTAALAHLSLQEARW